MGADHHHHRRVGPPDEEALKRLKGYEAREREASLGSARWDAEVERSLEIGLPGADSIDDKTISTFSRTELPHPGTRIIPGHDPEVWKDLPEAFA